MKQQPIPQVAEIAITYTPKLSASERPRVCTSKEAESIFRSVWQQPINHRESFYALFLDRGNKALGYFLVSIGGISGTVIDPRLIFQVALKANASAIIVAHNHPSGNREPSETDIIITGKLMEAGGLLDIQLLDHLILVPEGYYSMADEGKML